MDRRTFLATTAALTVSSSGAAPPERIIDTHTHFYDTTRPQGVPWPPKTEKILYRPVLPAGLEDDRLQLPVVGRERVPLAHHLRRAAGPLRQPQGKPPELALEPRPCVVVGPVRFAPLERTARPSTRAATPPTSSRPLPSTASPPHRSIARQTSSCSAGSRRRQTARKATTRVCDNASKARPRGVEDPKHAGKLYAREPGDPAAARASSERAGRRRR